MFILPPPPLLYNPGALRLRVPGFDIKVSWKKCEEVGGKLSNLSRYTTCFRSFVNILQTYPVAIVYFCLTYLCFTPLFRGWRWFCQVTLKSMTHTSQHTTHPFGKEMYSSPKPLHVCVWQSLCVHTTLHQSFFENWFVRVNHFSTRGPKDRKFFNEVLYWKHECWCHTVATLPGVSVWKTVRREENKDFGREW